MCPKGPQSSPWLWVTPLSPWLLRLKPQESSLPPFFPFGPPTNPSANPVGSASSVSASHYPMATTLILNCHLLLHRWPSYLASCLPTVPTEARVSSSKHGLVNGMPLLKLSNGFSWPAIRVKSQSCLLVDLTWLCHSPLGHSTLATLCNFPPAC